MVNGVTQGAFRNHIYSDFNLQRDVGYYWKNLTGENSINYKQVYDFFVVYFILCFSVMIDFLMLTTQEQSK